MWSAHRPTDTRPRIQRPSTEPSTGPRRERTQLWNDSRLSAVCAGRYLHLRWPAILRWGGDLSGRLAISLQSRPVAEHGHCLSGRRQTDKPAAGRASPLHRGGRHCRQRVGNLPRRQHPAVRGRNLDQYTGRLPLIHRNEPFGGLPRSIGEWAMQTATSIPIELDALRLGDPAPPSGAAGNRRWSVAQCRRRASARGDRSAAIAIGAACRTRSVPT